MTRFGIQSFRALVNEAISEEGARTFSRRTGIPHGSVRSMSEGRDISSSSLAAFCEALGYEIEISKKDVSPGSFAEDLLASFNDDSSPSVTKLTIEEGFLPFPWHELSRRSFPPPVAFSIDWLSEKKLAPADMRFVDLYGQTLALIDASSAHGVGVATWCWLEEDTLRLEWAVRDEDGPLVIFSGGDTNRPIKVHPEQVAKFRFLGRAVWTAQLEPADIA